MMSSVQGGRVTTRERCPDDETLAAYLDGTLDDQERRAVETHAADCETCLGLLAAVAPLLHDDEGLGGAVATFPGDAPAAPVPVATQVPVASSPLTGWMLPIAAGAVLLLGGGALVWQFSRPTVGLQTLQAVHVAERPTVGRLAGFAYAPPPVVTRGSEGRVGLSASSGDSGDSAISLLDAAAAVITARGTRTDLDSLHAAGVAHLIGGDVAAAIATLDRAVARAPGHAAVLADASAAYLQKGQATSDEAALARARDLARRAVAADPALAAAWFNLAQVERYAGNGAAEQRALATLRALEASSPWVRELER